MWLVLANEECTALNRIKPCHNKSILIQLINRWNI